MVRPWEVPYSVVDIRVGIACPFCAELPDAPVFAMVAVEEANERAQRVAVGERRVGNCRTGCGYD